MEMAVMIVERTDSRNTRMISTAKPRPRPPSVARSCRDSSISGDWSKTVVNDALLPRSRASWGVRSVTACETATASASELLSTTRPRAGRPSAREMEVRSIADTLTLASWSSRLAPCFSVATGREATLSSESGAVPTSTDSAESPS